MADAITFYLEENLVPTEVTNGQMGRVAGLRFVSSEVYATCSPEEPGPMTKLLTMTGTSAIANVIAGTVLTTSAPMTAVIVVALFALGVIIRCAPFLGAGS